MGFYSILRSAHSGWRYVVLILLVLAVVQALAGWFGKKSYTESNRKINVFTLISTHIQVVFGLLLYFMNDWYKADSSVAIGRYWKMEHIGMMILAVVLITIGNARSKKIEKAEGKHRVIAIYFGLALVVVAAAIMAMVKADASRTFFGIS